MPSPSFEEHRATCNEIVIDGAATVGSAAGAGESGGEEEGADEDSSKDDVIDPTDFLEQEGDEEGDGIVAEVEEGEEDGEGNDPEEEEEEMGALVIGEDDEEGEDEDMEEEEEEGGGDEGGEPFKSSTSKHKLDSLLGKAFKHPRRKCSICGYEVSYSNFRRHLRNAHPAQYREHGALSEGGLADQLSSEVAASSSAAAGTEGGDAGMIGHIVDEDEEEEEEEGGEGGDSDGSSSKQAGAAADRSSSNNNSEEEKSSIESRLVFVRKLDGDFSTLIGIFYSCLAGCPRGTKSQSRMRYWTSEECF